MNNYTIYVLPSAWKEIKQLPGNMRQRVKKAIDHLASEPRPSKSIALRYADDQIELRRLRLDRWRIVYAITDDGIIKVIDILTVRKRPPYDYGNLEELLDEIL